MDHILFIHSSVDGFLGCFYFLAIVNNTIKTVYKYLLESLLSVILGIQPEAESLGQMINMLIFSGTTILFCMAATPFYIPTNSAQRLQSLHMLFSLLFFFRRSHPNGHEVISHCGFDFHFSSDYCWHTFLCACLPSVWRNVYLSPLRSFESVYFSVV